MSSFLITGAAGFIGSHLVEKLLAIGHEVVGLDNFNDYYDPLLKERNLITAKGNKRFTLIRNDVLDRVGVESIFQKYSFDAVLHLAAKVGVRASLLDPVDYYKTNIEGTIIILELCRKYGIPKFIFASSSSVYGNNKKIPFGEEDNVDFPISPYAASKKSGELICSTYHHAYGISIFVLRFFAVYGPRQRPDMAIHKFTRLTASEEPVPVYGDGKLGRDFTYIDDIIQGVVNAIDMVKGFEIINLGTSQVVEIKSLIDIIEHNLNKKARLKTLLKQPGDVDITQADISKAMRILNYRPETNIEEGVRRFVEWFITEQESTAYSLQTKKSL